MVFNDKMWIMGGQTFTTYLNDVWSTDDGKTWARITGAAAWTKRGAFALAAFSNKLWVAGGMSGDEVYNNDVWCSVDGKTWTQATANAQWTARAYHASITFDNKLWVLGGSGKNNTVFNDAWYSTDGAQWTKASNYAAWKARFRFSSIVYNNKAWIIGGKDSKSMLGDVWFLDGQTGTGGQPRQTVRHDHLHAVDPNPFRGAVRIRFREERGTPVRIGIYNGVGREIARVYTGTHTGGECLVTWNGLTSRGAVPPDGVYFVRLEAGESTATRAIVRSDRPR